MSQEANAAALSEFWNSEAPMSEVRENLNAPNGWYDLAVTKLEPTMDDNGLIYIAAEFAITAPSEMAKGPGSSHRERFYIGSKKDPQAKLPETRLNAPGFARLKGIARVCDVPTNNQPVAALCAGLVGKSFTNRIETVKVKAKDGSGAEREFCNLGRNPVKLGTVPARLDSANALNGATAPAASTATPGVEFATE